MVFLSTAVTFIVPFYLAKLLLACRNPDLKKCPAEPAPLQSARSTTLEPLILGPDRAALRRRWRRAGTSILLVAALVYQCAVLQRVVRLRNTNPGHIPLIRERLRQPDGGGDIHYVQSWVPYDRISPSLKRAVIVGEDPRFWSHSGFDWNGIRRAIEEDWQSWSLKKGNSTISQQLAKNLFLTQSRTIVRKADEVVITIELETLLSKRRILELYLNIAEWGDGIFGAEASARHYFNISASELSDDQAALLAAILPAPLTTYNPQNHPEAVEQRRAWIRGLMGQIDLQD